MLPVVSPHPFTSSTVQVLRGRILDRSILTSKFGHVKVTRRTIKSKNINTGSIRAPRPRVVGARPSLKVARLLSTSLQTTIVTSQLGDLRPTSQTTKSENTSAGSSRVLCPGVGNSFTILCDVFNSGATHGVHPMPARQPQLLRSSFFSKALLPANNLQKSTQCFETFISRAHAPLLSSQHREGLASVPPALECCY